MITILIRTSNRPTQFKRCIESIMNQTYKDFKVIVYVNGIDYVEENEKITKIIDTKKHRRNFFWNLFCNELKLKVNEGHMFFLDDDDILIDNDVLLRLSKLLDENTSYICRMKRHNLIMPSKICFENKIVVRGDIGMPCIILHHSDKMKSFFDDRKAGDFRFIRDMRNKTFLKWIDLVLVDVQGEGKGKKEY